MESTVRAMNDSYASARRRRARLRAEVFARHGDVCHLCGQSGADTVDHLVPRSVASKLHLDISPFDPDNCLPAHRSCNSKRGAGRAVRKKMPTEKAVGW